MKQKLRQAETLIFKKEQEIINLRKNINITRLNECNSYIKASEEECSRLKGIINELMKNKNIQYENRLKLLQKESFRQLNSIKELENSKMALTSKLIKRTHENKGLKIILNNYLDDITKKYCGRNNELIRNIINYKETIMKLTQKPKRVLVLIQCQAWNNRRTLFGEIGRAHV